MSQESARELPEAVSVLVIGGSLVGLSAAMFLAARGVGCMVVERHQGNSPHPRARGVQVRSVEMFATAGLRNLPEVPAAFSKLRRVRTESMVATPKEEIDWTPEGAVRPAPAPWAPRSPCSGATLAQDQLEPLLRQRALELGASLCLGTELVRFEDRLDGVVAWLKDSQGAIRTVRADYLVGCDGNQSTVREALGITRQGIGLLQIMRSVLFRADLDRYRRGIGQWEIQQPGLDAFLAGYGDGRWVLMFRDDVEREGTALEAAIQQAIGTPTPAEILTTGRWELTALIADHFRKGRVFLAGDSAHTLPPNRGGYGANTGIADAFNLAWKLAAVVSGQSKISLLDSYEDERKPVAWMRFQQIFARPDYARYVDDTYRAVPLLDPTAIELGELYRSSIIDGTDSDLPIAQLPEDWRGQPGTRAPHRVVTRDGISISTLDLYGAGWVLVSSSVAWCEAATHIRERTGIPLSPINVRAVLGEDDGALVAQDLGIGGRGASLVRPDGVIAWRSVEGDGDVDTLERAVRVVAQPA
jgi:2-polyprenyl-6-methoxyphenol hydroxylase-like FAD-dependent oxidoreductase